MELTLTDIRICVDDVKACYEFYRDVIGLKPKFDASGSVYAEFETGGSALGIYQHDLMQKSIDKPHDDAVKNAAERVVLTFFVSNVDETFAELKKRGATVEHEPQDRPDWMLRIAHFRDPAGNLLEIHQPLAGQKV